MRTTLDRRAFLRVGAAGIVGSRFAATAAGSSRGWDDLSLAAQLDAVTRATAKYENLDAVGADGFESAAIPLYCGAGYHFDRVDRWETETDPMKPGSLFYVLDGNELRLGGAEYISITAKDGEGNPTDDPPDLFDDGDEPLADAPLLGTREADGWELVEEGDLVFWDLHVWVHTPNTAGVFHTTNADYEAMPGCVPLG